MSRIVVLHKKTAREADQFLKQRARELGVGLEGQQGVSSSMKSSPSGRSFRRRRSHVNKGEGLVVIRVLGEVSLLNNRHFRVGQLPDGTVAHIFPDGQVGIHPISVSREREPRL